MRGSRLFEWKGAVNDGLHPTLLDERPHLLAERGGDLPLLGHAARSKRGSGYREALAEDSAEVNGRGLAAQQADLDQPAFDGECRQVSRDVVATNDVEDEVDAAAAGQAIDLFDEVVLAVIDGTRCAEPLAGAALLV